MPSRRSSSRKWVASIAGLLPIGLIAAAAYAAPAPTGFEEQRGPNGIASVNVCTHANPKGTAHCFARVRTDDLARNSNARGPARSRSATPAATIGNNGAYDPAYLQAAYNAPSATQGAGQTIAVVLAYDNPYAESDLAYYRSTFGLSPCTSASGCFRKVDQRGGTSYPRFDSGWAQESGLDLDMASALCPNCKLLLVEADSNSFSNLGIAVSKAAELGATVISNSYGGSEWSTESSFGATYYNHPGVAVTVSSGDSGYGVEFPAASRYVTAVGGTTLYQTGTSGRNATETAWSGAGSGCSVYESKPSWQHDTGCSRRTVADVSAVADSQTPVWVRYNGGWYWFGGTSVAAPIIGGVYALAGNTESTNTLASYPYANTSALNDVVSGSNGSCSITYLCRAGTDYDGPTGLGTPNTANAFAADVTPPPPATVPAAPEGLSATAGDARVTLSWSAPSNNGGAAVTSYNVYGGTSSGGENFLTSVTTSTYADTGLSNGTTYYYKVTAVNSAGEGPAGSEVSATPVAAPAATVPGAPTLTSATRASGKGVSLSWTAPAFNGGSPITGYQVWRSTSPGAEVFYVNVSCTSSSCSYKDTNTTRNRTYYYKVAAVNGVGPGPLSNERSATAR